MKTPYTVVVEKDPESGWLVAEVVELPGCYTQAPDLATLEQNVREAIAVYRQTSEAHRGVGRDLDAPEFVGTWRVEVPA